MEILSTLKKYFGYDSFREGQEELITHILDGHDVLGIMPTGAGKSICYQLPAIMMEGITLVISPLISLMKDQVGALNQNGIRAAYLNSSLNYNQYQKALFNAKEYTYKIIYVAPERLMNEGFLEFAKQVNISMVCVDEAHCVSQWGQDFRPQYLQISKFVNQLSKRPIVTAFTATATAQVKEDIQKMLMLDNPFVLTTGFDRHNLYFAVEKPKDKYQAVLHYLKEHPNQSGIIYCLTRKSVEEVCERLCMEGFQATRYHAGLGDEERAANQDAFLYDQKPIIVATNAFGMGIDKSNVRFVIHYNMPKNMESYYQEAGRAGRDGERSDCILLYGAKDVHTNQFLIEQGNASENIEESMREELKQRELERLKSMTFYCSISGCLRHYMLNYFGEKSEGYCGNCSNCLSQYEEKDVSKEALAILHCIQETKERFGKTMILDILRGSSNAKIKNWHFDQLSCYGELKDTPRQLLFDLVDHMLFHEILKQGMDGYPILLLDHCEALLNGEPCSMKVIKEQKKVMVSKETVENQALFDRLRTCRAQLAKEAHVPPYIVFSDRTLHDMGKKQPVTKEEMLMVNGVGEVKYERYGEQFLSVIKEYQEEAIEIA